MTDAEVEAPASEAGAPASEVDAEANRDRIRQLIQSHGSGASVDDDADEIESLPGIAQLQAWDHRQDIALKKQYADWLLGAVILQLLLANAVFVVYAWAGKDWNLDAVVIDAWLGATLVQVIGVVTIVTRYLFPRRDGPTATGDR
jgi:hypothetical protein